VLPLASGVLLLVHGEGSALQARLAKPRSIAHSGQVVPAGIAPGNYQVETAIVNELPHGRHLCVLAKWVPVASPADG
jgi:hypothetical protein